MGDNNNDDQSSSSPPPYFIRGGFPFVFLPSAFATGFDRSKNSAHVSADGEPTTTSNSKEKKKNNEDADEEEGEGEESAETIDDDQADHNDENDEQPAEKNDLRISQPKYSQLLKGLDFSHSRMVDVTNLLPNELDQQENDFISDEDEHPPKASTKKTYEPSSSDSSDEGLGDPPTKNKNRNNTDDQKAKGGKAFIKAVNEIENELNNLGATIDQELAEKNHHQEEEEEEESEQSSKNLHKKPTFDEDDDTSKQATQNYDLHDTEKEDILPSSKSSKIPRLVKQQSKSIVTTGNSQNHSTKQKDDEELEAFISWEKLINETADPVVQNASETKTTPSKIQSQSTNKKSQEKEHFLSSSSEEEPKPPTRIVPQTKPISNYQAYQATSSSSSSSDSESVVQHFIRPAAREQSPVPPTKQPTPPVISSPHHHHHHQPPRVPPTQTVRQDSQATLIDENLDDLSSQLKQVLLDQERQTVNTSTKDERTTDGFGSMSFPISTPDVLSTDVLENDISNRPTDDLLRRFSNQRTDYNQQRQRNSAQIPERTSPPRKKIHHHHKHSTTRPDGINSRRADDNWLNMLERLEREHKARLEKQQQEYEEYMHDLEEKMKRRFDDYLTLTNGFQESRLDNHDETFHLPRRHTSIPIDSNIGRYKTHSEEPQHRPLAKDLISHYYPADSTLNVLTTEKQRSNVSTTIQRSPSTDDPINLRTELTAKHAKHIADLRLYYEYEINELKSQLNRSRMGQTSSSTATRQSIETIERINNENIRLHDEMKELRHSLKMTQDENSLLKRQVEELREQLTSKDSDLKNYHRTISDLEQQLTEAENTKERQDERSRHADRQVFFSHEETERLKTDLNLTRFRHWPEWERLLRLEERSREQENENETLRRQLFLLDGDTSRNKHRVTDDHKFNSTANLNVPTSKDYGRFTLSTTGKHLSSSLTSPREPNLYPGRYQSTNTENLFRQSHSPRPLTRISDYLNEKPLFPEPYVAPARHVYSPRKPSPNRRRVEPISTTRTSLDRQTKQTEQLEQKFDQLLKKKRDLETRLSRIPLRGLTNTDRQLTDVLEREIERVEQQLSSVKLELRKFNIIRAH